MKWLRTYLLMAGLFFGAGSVHAQYVKNLCHHDTLPIPNVFLPYANCGSTLPPENCFGPFAPEAEDFQVAVFNRWGNMLFESDNPMSRWHFMYKGMEIEAGVYYYVIRFTCDGDEKEHTGYFHYMK